MKNSEDAMADYSMALEPYSSIALASIEALTTSDVSSALDTQRWLAQLKKQGSGELAIVLYHIIGSRDLFRYEKTEERRAAHCSVRSIINES